MTLKSSCLILFVLMSAISCSAVLFAETPLTVDSGLRCSMTQSYIVVCDNKIEVLRYNITAPKAPDDARSSYERSGYIHPIRTPSGRIATGDFAVDHPHQHGLFAAWTSTMFRGKKVDFWNQHKGLGIVLHDRVVSVESDGSSAGFSVGVKHCALEADGSSMKVLDDVWTLVVSKPTNDRYEVDFSVSQTNVTDDPLTINEYHYGGIGFRGSNEWVSEDSEKKLKSYSRDRSKTKRPSLAEARHRFLTSEGGDRWLGNHTRPEWAALFGLVDDAIVTVKARSKLTNERHPHPMRLHPSKPYFSISPCVLGEFTIEPGSTYKANYRFEIIDGEPKS